jgi:hypothetical protein
VWFYLPDSLNPKMIFITSLLYSICCCGNKCATIHKVWWSFFLFLSLLFSMYRNLSCTRVTSFYFYGKVMTTDVGIFCNVVFPPESSLLWCQVLLDIQHKLATTWLTSLLALLTDFVSGCYKLHATATIFSFFGIDQLQETIVTVAKSSLHVKIIRLISTLIFFLD